MRALSKGYAPLWPIKFIALVWLLSPLGCGQEQALRSAGEACTQDEGCEANLCFESTCLEPAADDDLDGLTNAIEVALGTAPQEADSDGDGVPDGWEVGSPQSPADEDGDGLIDALESALDDEDADCIPDQKDKVMDGVEEDLLALADKACCCDGLCSDSGVEVSPASCAQDSSGQMVITCPEGLQPDEDGDEIPDVCDPCPEESDNICALAPHSLSLSPESPSSSLTPTLSGVAIFAATVEVLRGGCEGEPVAEIPGTAGEFSIALEADSNQSSTFYVVAKSQTDALIGCGEPQTYLHDDVPPEPPLIGEIISSGDALFVEISAEGGVSLALYDNKGCEGEPIQAMNDTGAGVVSINLVSPFPGVITASARDKAGNESDCSEYAAIESSFPGAGIMEGAYVGSTCLVEPPCSSKVKTHATTCEGTSGELSAALNHEGTLWTIDVCERPDVSTKDVALTQWPEGSASIERQEMTDFVAETALTPYGKSMALWGMGSKSQEEVPTFLGFSPEGEESLSWPDSLLETILTKRPMIVSDSIGWLYSLGDVPTAPEETLTLLVKPSDSETWGFAPGMSLAVGPGDVPEGLQGVAIEPGPPSDLHVLLWRDGSASDHVAYYGKIQLDGTFKSNASELALPAASIQPVDDLQGLSSSGGSQQSVARIALVRELNAQGEVRWTPYIAHWVEDQSALIKERLVLLRRDEGPSGEGIWTMVHTHSTDEMLLRQAKCSEKPTGPDSLCTYTLERERLLDLAGGAQIQMLVGQYSLFCQLSALCSSESGGCLWAESASCEAEEYGYLIKHGSGFSLPDAMGRSVWDASEAIEEGALLIDDQGVIHVVLVIVDEGALTLYVEPYL